MNETKIDNSDMISIPTSELQQKLSEIRSRLGYGAIKKIAKKVKKSDDTILLFFNNKLDMNSELCGKILDAISDYLTEVTEKGKQAEHKIDSIINNFPAVKK